MQRERGFTLIELLIVVAIVGIIAAIAIPNLLGAIQRAKQKRTMSDIRTTALAWESRATETGDYTAAGLSICCTVSMPIADIEQMLVPTFTKKLNSEDGWGREIEFAVDADGRSYMIRSYGRDGLREASPEGGPTTNFDKDLIYSIGQFVQYPEGVQTQ